MDSHSVLRTGDEKPTVRTVEPCIDLEAGKTVQDHEHGAGDPSDAAHPRQPQHTEESNIMLAREMIVLTPRPAKDSDFVPNYLKTPSECPSPVPAPTCVEPQQSHTTLLSHPSPTPDHLFRHEIPDDVLYDTEQNLECAPKTSLSTDMQRNKQKIHVIPMPRNPNFRGRHDDLHSLHAILDPQQTLKSPKTVTLCGIGGVGKTQTALEYVYSHLEDFDVILWASADTEVKLNQAFGSFAIALGLVDNVGSSNVKAVQQGVKKALAGAEHQWLMVFDNVDDAKLILDFWPTSPMGSILLTTRTHQAFSSPTKWKHRLQSLDTEASSKLMLDQLAQNGYVKDAQDLHFARELCTELGGLPLAITQIVGFVLNVGCILSEVCDIFKEHQHPEILFVDTQESIDCFYQLTLSNVWDVTFSKFDDATTMFVAMVSFLDPDNIDEGIFEPRVESRTILPEFLGSRARVLRIIGLLSSYDLIKRSPLEKTFAVHRLVQAYVLRKMSPVDWSRAFDHVVDLLYDQFPQQALGMPLHKSHETCDKFLSHAIKLSLHYKDMSVPLNSREKLAELLHNATWYMFERGWFQQVFPVLNVAVKIYKDIGANESLGLSLILNTYGSTYLELGDPETALRYLKQVRRIRESRLPPRDPVISNILHNCAMATAGLGDYQAAEALCKEAISIREDLPDATHALYKANALPKNYTTYCKILYRAGDLRLAELMGRKSLDLALTHLGRRHQNTAQAYCTLAEVLHSKGHEVEALDLHLQSLSLREELLGTHYQTAASHYQVAIVVQDTDPMKARLHLENALAMYSKLFGCDRPTARTKYRLAGVYRSLEQNEESNRVKAEASHGRLQLTGIPYSQNDSQEAYDELVGWMEC